MNRIQYRKYGGPDVMRYEYFNVSGPQKGQVLIRVKAASINPTDWKIRRGEMKFVTGKKFPRAMGFDFAGVVDMLGPGVTRFNVGDHVFGMATVKESGAFAEALVIEEEFVAIKPPELTFEDAACLPTASVTAWNALVDKGNIKSGDTVFIGGCMGSVGKAAVQIACLKGAKIHGSCEKDLIDQARDLGVKYPINFIGADYSGMKGKFDIFLDTSGQLPLAARLGMLNKHGVVAELLVTPGKYNRSLFNRKIKIVICTPTHLILEQIARAAATQKLKIPIGKTVAFKNAIELITEIEQGKKIGGKGVLIME